MLPFVFLRSLDKKWVIRELLVIFPSMVIYLINRLTKNLNEIPFLGYVCKCHLNDFIGGVVFCAYFNMLLHICGYRHLHRMSHILLLTFLCGMVWEFVFPIILPYSISDPLDVVSYVLGGTLYYLLTRKNDTKRRG